MTTRLQKNVKQYFKDNIGITGAPVSYTHLTLPTNSRV